MTYSLDERIRLACIYGERRDGATWAQIAAHYSYRSADHARRALQSFAMAMGLEWWSTARVYRTHPIRRLV